MIEEAVEVRPYFSRCSIGKGRWFWVAYGSLDDVQQQKIHSFGMAATSEDAERDARASLAKDFAVPVCQWTTSLAAKVHRRMSITKRAAKTSDGEDAAQQEFVYTYWCSDYGDEGSAPHRIVKKTAKRVYVERRNESWEENGQTYYDVRTIVLDRAELEREGSAYSRTDKRLYCTTPYETRRASPEPPCLELLGLARHCTLDDVNRAYRRLAMQAHPDRGGNAEDFKKLQRAYEDALQLVA